MEILVKALGQLHKIHNISRKKTIYLKFRELLGLFISQLMYKTKTAPGVSFKAS